MSITAGTVQGFKRELAALAPHRSVCLLAVSKTQSAAVLREAHAAGLEAFGENYVQEALEKQDSLRDLKLEWHFIGPLQSNKSRAVAESFAWVHSVDRLKLAQRLAEQRPPGMAPLQMCLQVNVSGEESKAGVAPAEVPALAQAIHALPGLRLRGLMCIPEPSEDPSLLRTRFQLLHSLRADLQRSGLPLDTLSMGMSSDYRLAVAEGATIVRIGSALFGARPARSTAGSVA